MSDIEKNNELDNQVNTNIAQYTEQLLVEARSVPVPEESSIIMPLAKLSTLGGGISSLIPAFNTVTQTSTVNMGGLYRLTNKAAGDMLKESTKTGDFWGAFKTAEGGSKMAKLVAADPVSVTSKSVMNVNPAMIAMAVALYAIEKELEGIKDMQKEILSFLEIEKQAEIEADVITTTDIVTKFKYNWDNERYIASNHKMVCDITRNARKNLIFYQKQVSEALKAKNFIIAGNMVDSSLKSMQKKFMYYRLSLYAFSISSLTEVILSGNYREEKIAAATDEIRKASDEYRDLYSECSIYLENMSKGSIESNVLNGIGFASKAVGNLVRNIPRVKQGPVDEFLIDQGEKMESNAKGMNQEVIKSFSQVSDPNTRGVLVMLEDFNKIYNRTIDISFDEKYLYLITG